MIDKRIRKNRLTSLLLGGSLLLGAVSAVAAPDIGTEVWQQKFNPITNRWNNAFFRSVGFNVDGSVLVSGWRGEADSDSAIGIRYNAVTGAVLDSPAEWFLFEYSWADYTADRFADQYVDSSGDIYFAGMSYANKWNVSSSRYNLPSVWKYDSAYVNPDPAQSGNPGRPVWKTYYTKYGDPAIDNGMFNGMAVDSAGNIIAAGYFNNLTSTSSNRDWIIDKYDSDGNRATGFPLSYNKDDLHDYANDVAVDSEDNFVVVGFVTIDATADHQNWVVRKYSNDGTLLWATEYDYAGGSDQAYFVTIDSDDNIVVSGNRRNALPGDDNDWYMVKYAKDGDGAGGADVLWEQSWDPGDSTHGVAYQAVLDGLDNFYTVGAQQQTSVVTPVYTDRYRAVLQYRDGQTGDLISIQNIPLDPTANNKPALEHDYLRTLALDGAQLTLAGYTQQDGGYSVTRGGTGRVVMLTLSPFEVTPSVIGNGMVSPDTAQNVDYDTTTQFMLDPDDNHHIDSIAGTCLAGPAPVDNSDGTWTYTTGAIAFDCTVIVHFVEDETFFVIPIEGNKAVIFGL